MIIKFNNIDELNTVSATIAKLDKFIIFKINELNSVEQDPLISVDTTIDIKKDIDGSMYVNIPNDSPEDYCELHNHVKFNKWFSEFPNTFEEDLAGSETIIVELAVKRGVSVQSMNYKQTGGLITQLGRTLKQMLSKKDNDNDNILG